MSQLLLEVPAEAGCLGCVYMGIPSDCSNANCRATQREDGQDIIYKYADESEGGYPD